ncbi:MAG: hypothetical protein CMI62_07455 [Parvibaculum sp.]|jgi:UDP-glucuronate decarboxylase|uniref:NAD-dependent epimerase/dehydratase family protein n=1 Tax=Parvibaculum sp. TaxID=2024848 RepID=UPI000C3A2E22|nr:NAD-dependent epimerase/dehydratase family protein [Parvibaculum sp.]MAU60549.1 hypothetical protein [Parvibaculum sp.]|tara:strand:- start:8514 stop:9755 length:1242 start_codon:yes stop_codon:yes gene_type:complete
MTVRWITPLLGTAPGSEIAEISDAVIVDVRNFVDRAGNLPDSIAPKLIAGSNALREGRKTVICCDHGISRSNAFAAGILALFGGISVNEALHKVINTTGESEIRPDVLAAVRRALSDMQAAKTKEGSERWLLTGGSGALGRLIQRTVPSDLELLAPSRTELDLLAGSMSLSLYAETHNVSRILHFASPRVGNTNRAMGEALTMLRTALEAARYLSVPVIIPSRWNVFAGYYDTLIASETTPARPDDILGETKFLCESLALAWESQKFASVTVLRSGLVFGDEIAPHFMRGFIRKARSGELLMTHSYANGSPALDLMASDDWARAFWSLARSGLTGLFQAGGGDLLSTRQIAEMAVAAEGRGCQIEELRVEGKAANVKLDFTKLRDAVGWSPSRPSFEALGSFLSHARTVKLFP